VDVNLGLSLRKESRLRVFENRVLRRIFASTRDEVTGEWRILHSEELHELYCSPNIISIIKSGRMRWAGNVARIGDRRDLYSVLVGDLREGDHLEDLGVDGRIILKWMFKTWHGGMDRIDVAQDWDRWRALLNAVMNPGVAENSGNFLSN
jgi:hypothetical protein